MKIWNKVLTCLCLLYLLLADSSGLAQVPSTSRPETKLQFVVYLTRHGVRSPTGDPTRYDPYSSLPWPQWEVPPGYLTPHGYTLMNLFGAYDRAWLASAHLFSASGCNDATHVTVLADSDERTRETGKALIEGMFPGCAIPLHAQPEGMHDPIFHSPGGDPALSLTAIEGRIGGDPNNLTSAYHGTLEMLDHVLGGCGHARAGARKWTSLLDVPAELKIPDGHTKVEMRGPLNTASSLTEDLLLEYTDNKPAADVGWGCVDGSKLRNLMTLHNAGEDFADRTPTVARAGASNLLNQVLMAMEQHVTGKPVTGAQGKPEDRLLMLVGHDTNIANVAGLLNLSWILDGRRNDTPPGGALVFELWRSTNGEWFVRVYYTAQTLEQMRDTQVLTLSSPPDRVPISVPGCVRHDMSCTWPDFSATVQHALQPQ